MSKENEKQTISIKEFEDKFLNMLGLSVEENEEDVVNEPNHYKHGSFETIDEMVIVFGIENTITFCKMNAWKYRSRAPFKGNMEQDMAKANCYLEMAAELSSMKDKNFQLLKG